MENLYENVNSWRSFYVQKKKDFDRAIEVMRLMPSYAFYEKEKLEFVDAYLETPDNFLKEMGVTLWVRKLKDKQIISVKYDEALLKKQEMLYKNEVYEQEIGLTNSIFETENLLFIEDKLTVIFGGRLQIDILHKLKELREIYLIKTKRKSYEIVHNSGLRADVFFDELTYINKLKAIEYNDLILEMHMTSLSTELNKKLFETFINNLRDKLILVPMEDTRYQAAILYTRFKK